MIDMRFDGFDPDIFKFFRQIKKNNNREWFHKNKTRYDKIIKEPAATLVENLNADPMFRKLHLSMNPKKALFRLNRDVRFSADKSPYKTYNGISISRTGKRNEDGVFYLHLEPGECFFGVGFWMPDPNLLSRFRLQIAQNWSATQKMLRDLKRAKIELGTFATEGSLKRIPRGFEHVTHPQQIDLLKRRSLIVGLSLKESDVQNAKLVAKASQFLKRAAPLLKWGWPIVDQWRLESGNYQNEA